MVFCIPSRLSMSSLIASLCVAIAAWLTPVGDRRYHQMSLPWNLLAVISSILFFLGIDILLLNLAYRYNTRARASNSSSSSPPPRHLDFVRDFVDLVVLVAGLILQGCIDPEYCGWPCLQLILALFVLIFTFFLIIKPRMDLGVADLFLAIISVFMVYFSKRNEKWSAAATGFVSFILIFVRNHYEKLKNGEVKRTLYAVITNELLTAVKTRLANFSPRFRNFLVYVNWIISLGGEEDLELQDFAQAGGAKEKEQAGGSKGKEAEKEPLLATDQHRDVASSSTVGEAQKEITSED